MRRTAIGPLLTVVVVAALVGRAADASAAGTNGRIFFQPAGVNSVYSLCPGAPTVQFHRSGVGHPDVSADAEKLVYYQFGAATDPGTGIYINDLRTDAETKITGAGGIVDTTEAQDNDKDAAHALNPRFSPDGTKLLVHNENKARSTLNGIEELVRHPAVIDLATGAYTPLLDEGDIDMRSIHRADWAPDGETIYFTARRLMPGGGSVDRLFRMSADGGEPTDLDPEGVYHSGADASPDGLKVLATKQEGTTNFVVELGHDGAGGPTKLRESGYGGRYSPDGTRIAYIDHLADDLTIMDVDGTDPVRQSADAEEMAWSSTLIDCDDSYGGVRINEVMVSHADDPERQFVELLGAVDHPFPSSDGLYGLAVFDADNVRVAQHNFPEDFLSGKDTSKEILISNAAADTALGVTGDFQTPVPLTLPTDAGRVCLTAKGGGSIVNCVAYGCFSAADLEKTSYGPLPPTGQSIQRQGISTTIWRIAGPTPKQPNVAGASAENCVPPPDGDGDGSPTPADCDDGNPGVRPGASEILDNGVDEDCDGADAKAPPPPPPPNSDGGGPVVTPMPPIAPVDTTGPTVVIPAKSKSLAATKAGLVSFSFGPVEEDTTGVISLKTDGKVKTGAKKKVLKLASDKSFQALTGQKVVIKIKLSKAARKLLKKSKRIKVQANITLRDAKGNATVKAYKFVIKAAKKKT